MADRNTRGWRWQVVDSWAFIGNDATPFAIRSTTNAMKASHPTASVLTAKRSVRAHGADIPVTAIVARIKKPSCTCGKAIHGQPAAYLTEQCAFCNTLDVENEIEQRETDAEAPFSEDRVNDIIAEQTARDLPPAGVEVTS